MDFSIRGSGGGFMAGRKPPARRRNPAHHLADTQEIPAASEPSVVYETWLPEQSRAAIAAVNLAVQAAETATGVIYMASQSLTAIAGWISVLEREAAQAVEGTVQGREPPGPLSAPEAELHRARQGMDAVVAKAVFGGLRLLDGSLGCTGKAFGEGLEFVAASPLSRASPPEGYPVWIWQEASRAFSVRPLPPASEYVGQALRLIIEADGRQAVHHPLARDSATDVAEALARRAMEQGLEVSVHEAGKGRLMIRHHRFGSGHSFILKSSLPGIFSLEDGRPRLINNGQDVAGSINGEPAYGEGQLLTGCAGNKTTDGISVRFGGVLPDQRAGPNVPKPSQGWNIGLETTTTSEEEAVGRLILAQQGLVFRLGPRTGEMVSIRLNSVLCRQLGMGITTASGFRSVAEICLDTPQQARDALLVIRRAEEEVAVFRQRLDDLAHNVLVEVLANLRKRATAVSALSTTIMDSGGGRGMAHRLRTHIPLAASMALSAQNSSVPGAILKLLGTDSTLVGDRNASG